MTLTPYVDSGGYIVLPVTTNPKTIYQKAVAAINRQLPGWIPRESQLDNILLEQFSAMIAEAANVAAAVPKSIFAYLGALLGIVPNPGSEASAFTTWTMVDAKGYTVPRGTTVGYQVLGNQLYTFTVKTAFTIPVGTTQAHDVNIEATSVGVAYNGFVPQTLVLVSPSLTYVRTIASSTITSGGATPEGLTSYLNRLSEELQLLSPRPILTPDFAVLARNVTGVYRAAAYNNLNPFANNLSTEDATFTGGLGTWTAVSNCSVTNVTGSGGKDTMKITATTTGNAIVGSGFYPVPETAFCVALLSLDPATGAPPATVVLQAVCYGATTGLLEAFTSPMTTVVHRTGVTLTFVSLPFTTPPGTTHLKLRLTVETATVAHPQYVAFPGLFQLNSAPNNLIPDSTLAEVSAALSWHHSVALVVTIYATSQWAFVYTGTGSASGSDTAHSEMFYLPAGEYTVGAYIDATYVTHTTHLPKFAIIDKTTAVLVTAMQTYGKKGFLSATFTLTSPTMVQFAFETNDCTVQDGLPLTFVSPYLVRGATPQPYTPGLAWGPPDVIYDNERMVTVAVVDKTGDALDSVVEAAVATYLESLREVNFIVNVIGPSYTTIDVSWTGFVTTANPTTVRIAANTALQKYLSPAFWGGGTETPPLWNASQTVVRYLEVATVIGETPGLTLTNLVIGIHGGTLSTTNVTLLGFAPLPRAGTIIGTVTTT